MKLYEPTINKKFSINSVDPSKTGSLKSADDVEEQMQEDLKDLNTLHYKMYAENRRSLLVVLQGIDASGKDGTVRHVAQGLTASGLRVYSYKKPTDDEYDHDYLWRIHKNAPGRGEVAIFNRSHYEEVLVVRVHHEFLAGERLPLDLKFNDRFFDQRYRQINDFERMMVENGTTILKFFLHISPEVQQKRFEERMNDPKKQWKYSSNDINESKFWDKHMEAAQMMLRNTHTKHAPWYVVPADRKWYRNFLITRTIVHTMKKLKMSFPKAAV